MGSLQTFRIYKYFRVKPIIASTYLLPEQLTVDLHRNVTSDGDETYGVTGPPVVKGPPVAWFRPDLHRPAKTRSKLAQVKIRIEAPSTRLGFGVEIPMSLCPASPTDRKQRPVCILETKNSF
jgi:hypothetical protein